MEYLTPEEMREAESRAVAGGVSISTLMENAGAAVAATVLGRYGDQIKGRPILVICGTGNNGGDGLVAARHLSPKAKVRVLLLADSPSSIKTDEARANWQRLSGLPVEVVLCGTREKVAELSAWFEEASVLIDAILGTGAKGALREPIATAVRMFNASRGIRVAVDLPSGLDPASGAVSESGCIRADITIALHRAKSGLRGRAEYTGELVVVPIGISEGAPAA